MDIWIQQRRWGGGDRVSSGGVMFLWPKGALRAFNGLKLVMLKRVQPGCRNFPAFRRPLPPFKFFLSAWFAQWPLLVCTYVHLLVFHLLCCDFPLLSRCVGCTATRTPPAVIDGADFCYEYHTHLVQYITPGVLYMVTAGDNVIRPLGCERGGGAGGG